MPVTLIITNETNYTRVLEAITREHMNAGLPQLQNLVFGYIAVSVILFLVFVISYLFDKSISTWKKVLALVLVEIVTFLFFFAQYL